MAIIYRTDGAWGAGKGSNLAPAEVDENFYDVSQRVSYIEDNPVLPIEPISITITGYNFYMGLSNGETLGPVIMTMPVPEWRGEWTPATLYHDMDFFTAPAPDGGFGAVMQSHTSAATFDWAAVGGNGLPNYRLIVGGSGMTVALSGLTDVALSGIATGDMLVWDGASSYWRNLDPVEVAEGFAVFGGDTGAGGTQGMVPAPIAGDAAAGKVLGAGGTWIVPPAGEGGGATSLAGLSDVAIAGPSNLSVLQYQASDGKWHNAALGTLGGTVTSVGSGTGLTGGPIVSTGSLSLAPVADKTILANVVGGLAAPAPQTLSAILDAILGSARGSVLRRDATGWTVLPPGGAGEYLRSGGAGADVSWSSPAGSGTVTSVGTGAGLTGGPITGSGTVMLANVADASILANLAGSSAAPIANTLSAILDHVLGGNRGNIVYRGAASWLALPPGANGTFLQTRGVGADPTWAAVKGGAGGTGTSVTIWNLSCDLATAAALPACTYANGTAGVGATLTASANGALSVDGEAVDVADRILVKDQSNLAHNGIYTVTAAGSGAAPFVLTRATDFDATAEILEGSSVAVTTGDANHGTAWVQITGATVTVGTTSIEFDAIAAVMPICAPGQVLGNPLAVPAPAVPMDPVDGGGGTSLPAGTTHDQLVYVGGAWTAQRPRYIVAAFAPGVPTASQTLLMHTFSKAVTFGANFAAYLGHASQARGTAAATASTVIAVQKATAAAPGTFAAAGTITFAAAGITGTFATSGGTPITFAAGDTLALVAPASPDASFAGFAATLAGMET
jgi:hypothetical protein